MITNFNNSNEKQTLFLAGVFALLVFFVPLVPDIRLARPKLLLLETIIYSSVFLFLLISFYFGKLKIRNSLLWIPLILYTCSAILFYLFSSDKPVALNELKRACLSVSVFVLCSSIITSSPLRNLVLFFMVGGSFFSFLYGVLQHFGGFWIVYVPHLNRAMSTFGNPIFFAVFIVTMLPICLGLFFSSKKSSFIIVFFLGIIALYFTQTRASYIAFVFSMIVFFLLTIKSSQKKILMVVLLCSGFAMFSFFTRSMWFRHQAHLLIWRDSLSMWASNPFTGTGPGTFHIYFPYFASDKLKAIWPQEKCIVNDAHNEYIQLLTETGIIGFGIFVFLIIAFYKNSFLVLRKSDENQKYIISGLISSASGILVQNMFSVDMRFIISSVYLFIVFGLIESFNEEFYEVKISNIAARYSYVTLTAVLAFFIMSKILIPYIAQKKLSQTPDFFDEKILEPAKTVQELTALSKKYPDKASVFEKLGWVYAKEKNFDSAIRSYEKAIELNSTVAGPYNNLGNIHFLIGNRDKAISLWKKSLEINSSQTDSRLNLALAYYYKGLLKQASDEIKKVLELDPKNSKALVLLKQMTE